MLSFVLQSSLGHPVCGEECYRFRPRLPILPIPRLISTVSTPFDVLCACHYFWSLLLSLPLVPLSNPRSRHNANRGTQAIEGNADHVCMHPTFSILTWSIIHTLADLLHFPLVLVRFDQPLNPLSIAHISPNYIHLAYPRFHCPVSLALAPL